MVNVRPSNGVSYGVRYQVTAADATAGEVTFDFNISGGGEHRNDLVASVQITSDVGLVAQPSDLTITYPAKGKVVVAGTLLEDSIINLIAQRAIPTV